MIYRPMHQLPAETNSPNTEFCYARIRLGYSRIGSLRQLLCGCEVIRLAFWINQIKRLRQIDFLQQVMSETSRVGGLDHEIVGEFAREREVDDMRIRRFQVVIDAPCDRQSISIRIIGWSVRKPMRRRRNLARWDIRCPYKPGISRRIVDGKYARRIADGRRQSPRTLTVKSVYHAFSEMIKIYAITRAYRTLTGIAENLVPESSIRMRGVSDRKTRGEIVIIPSPIRLSAVRLAGEIKR